jgi:hypothetical protein
MEDIMKTLKLTMIVAILSFAMISYAGIEPTPVAKKVVKISLSHALRTPGLNNVMIMQLQFSDLQVNAHGIYVGTVEYHKVVYKISAKRIAWIRFFLSISKTIERAPNGT